MSAIGPKQTWALALHMSAFGGKADMTFCAKADIGRSLPVCQFDRVRCLVLSLGCRHEAAGISRPDRWCSDYMAARREGAASNQSVPRWIFLQHGPPFRDGRT